MLPEPLGQIHGPYRCVVALGAAGMARSEYEHLSRGHFLTVIQRLGTVIADCVAHREPLSGVHALEVPARLFAY